MSKVRACQRHPRLPKRRPSGTIYNGDCIATMREQFTPGSVDLVVADPPYNISHNNKASQHKNGRLRHRITAAWDKMSPEVYTKFTENWIQAAHRLLTPSGSIYVCAAAGPTITEVLVALREAGFLIKNIICWHRPNCVPNPFGKRYTSASDLIIFAVKGKGWTFNAAALRDINPERQKNGSPKMMRDVWIVPATSSKERLWAPSGRALHPAQKPMEVIERMIVGSSNKGDVVLDPFLGSGTTAVVAEAHSRRWFGIEQDEHYIEAAQARLEAMRATMVSLNDVND